MLNRGRYGVAAAGMLLIAICQIARAADVSHIGTQEFPVDDCYGGSYAVERHIFEISGPIQQGDSELLRRLFAMHGIFEVDVVREQNSRSGDQAPTLSYPPIPPILSLNSEGGSLSEAIEIVEFITSLYPGLVTLVDSDATCLSACAVVFMAGWSQVEECPFERTRIVSLPGSVGFHAPFVDLISMDTSSDELPVELALELAQSAYRGANTVIAAILEDEPSSWPTSLLAEMLLAGSEDAVWIDTVDMAAESDIQISNAIPPIINSEGELLTVLYNYCYNVADVEIYGLPREIEFEISEHWIPFGGFFFIDDREFPDNYVDSTESASPVVESISGSIQISEGWPGLGCGFEYSPRNSYVELSNGQTTWRCRTDIPTACAVNFYSSGTRLNEIPRSSEVGVIDRGIPFSRKLGE
ncbi:MAG: hypothetical protein AAF362_18335 [Pseudomonadota bacterium]